MRSSAMLAILLLGCLVLLGCPKAPTPTLYPVALPELDDPTPLVYERAPDTCDGPIPILTGSPVPVVGPTGAATCGGILLGDDAYAHLLHTERAALPWFEAYARECADGRERDRVWAQAVSDHQTETTRQLARDNRALRLLVPAAFVGGLATGGALAAAVVSVQVSVAR